MLPCHDYGSNRHSAFAVRAASACLLSLGIAGVLASADAAEIRGPSGSIASCRSPDRKYTVSLTPNPAEHLNSPSDAQLKLLRDTYKKWEFGGSGGNTADGTFNILQYDAFCGATIGGANFSMLYDDGHAEKRTDYNWISFGYPDDWGSFGNTPFVDSEYSNVPFYSNLTPFELPTARTPTRFYGDAIWLDPKNYPQQAIQNPPGGGRLPAGDLLFVDEPYCSYTCSDRDGHAHLILETFLVTFTWNGEFGARSGGSVTIYDGVRWGVQIEPTKIPEPGTWGALLLLAIVAANRARRGRRAATPPTRFELVFSA